MIVIMQLTSEIYLLMKHSESLSSIGRARPACKLLHYSSFDDSDPDEGESYGLSTEIRRELILRIGQNHLIGMGDHGKHVVEM
jgi:hypothetical protein